MDDDKSNRVNLREIAHARYNRGRFRAFGWFGSRGAFQPPTTPTTISLVEG